jgi:CC2D2A N-terminal C2 domain
MFMHLHAYSCIFVLKTEYSYPIHALFKLFYSSIISYFFHIFSAIIFHHVIIITPLQTRCAIGSLTATLYATWRAIQEVRRKQGFSSTTACLTVRKVNIGYEEGNIDGEIGDDLSNERRENESGRRRRDRRGRDRGRDNDRDRENTTPSKRSNSRTKVGKKKEESDNEENGSNKFRSYLDSLPDLLEKVQDLFLRDAAAKIELKNQELQDQIASSLTSVMSGKDTTKHKNSHMTTRGSVILGERESTVPVPAPLGELDEFNVYIADSMPSVLECIRELLRGNPGPRGDDADTPGQGGYSLSPEYVIRVSEEGQITANTFLNATELYRRRLLNELRYKFVLVVNGKAVTHSEYVELRHPSLIAEINQYFELRLVYEPTDLAIDIIAVNIGSLPCFKKGMLKC